MSIKGLHEMCLDFPDLHRLTRVSLPSQPRGNNLVQNNLCKAGLACLHTYLIT